MKKYISMLAVVVATVGVTGCATPPPVSGNASASSSDVERRTISYAMVKRDLRIGTSTQAEVIRLLGSPNNMVYHGRGGELWIYDRLRTETSMQTQSSSSGLGVGVGGGGVVVGAGAGSSGSSGSTSTSVRNLTIILEFDSKGVLTELTAREGSY